MGVGSRIGIVQHAVELLLRQLQIRDGVELLVGHADSGLGGIESGCIAAEDIPDVFIEPLGHFLAVDGHGGAAKLRHELTGHGTVLDADEEIHVPCRIVGGVHQIGIVLPLGDGNLQRGGNGSSVPGLDAHAVAQEHAVADGVAVLIEVQGESAKIQPSRVPRTSGFCTVPWNSGLEWLEAASLLPQTARLSTMTAARSSAVKR